MLIQFIYEVFLWPSWTSLFVLLKVGNHKIKNVACTVGTLNYEHFSIIKPKKMLAK